MAAEGRVKPRPLMKSSRIRPGGHSVSAPISGARKVKIPSTSPSTGCASAPAAPGRAPAGGASALKPKRGASGVSVRVARERHSAPSTQKPPYVLVPVRVKRTGLKLLDPEKVRSLMSASRLHVSGAAKPNLVLPQSTINKQPLRSCKQSTLPRSSAKPTASSRKRMGVGREIINPSGRGKDEADDDVTRGHQLCHQMDQLLLEEKCDESSKSDNGHLQNVQPGAGRTDPHDGGRSEETNIQDNEKSSHPPDLSATAGCIDEADEGGTLVSDPQTGDVPDYEESQVLGLREENRSVKDRHHEGPPAHPSRPDINVADGLYKPGPEPRTGASSVIQGPSGRGQMEDAGTGDHRSQEGDSDAAPESSSPDGHRCKTILGPNPPGDEQNAHETRTRDLTGHLCGGACAIIRQSQGVLVLASSTEGSAVFIPKLQFDFTPDNSIDWTRPGAQKGGAPKTNDLRLLSACSPGGPTFSKSAARKASMRCGQQAVPGVASHSALADSPNTGACPPHTIVDLSISFQGKYEEQEIPADIPKIPLTEEDHDED